MQTEFDFTLPRGYLDASGMVHQHGRMRLATGMDEIQALSDPLVQENDAYLPVTLLSRVVVGLGDLPAVNRQVIAGLFAADLAYLEDLYLRTNGPYPVIVGAVCPHCSGSFQLQVAPLGETGFEQG